MAEYDYIIRKNITNQFTFKDNSRVLIAGPVKVTEKAVLKGRNITFEIAAGVNEDSEINRNYLFFASGSTAVMAGQTRIYGDGNSNSNGAVFFAGNNGNISYEGIPTLSSNVNDPSPYFTFESLEMYNLGSLENDLNGITLLGLKFGQFNAKSLTVGNSGDDVLELFGSNVEVENLNTLGGGDDNIDLDDLSNLVIIKSLNLIQVGNNSIELSNKSAVVIAKGCVVTLACNKAKEGNEVIVVGDENLQKVNTGTTPTSFVVQQLSKLLSNDC